MSRVDVAAIIGRLERGAAAVQALCAVASAQRARWKPAPEHWSILEVCCHLLDEEREDFRVRLRSTLEDSARPWPALDLVGVAEKRKYNERDLAATLDEFVRERRASIAWLRSLAESTDFNTAYQHPKFGPIYAGDLLASWAAHDALHLRQIAKRLHGMAADDAPGFAIAYAGEW
ncbi:MAG: DinB family protein [Phycisphaerales bacterium]|nr:DinB family protein [Phycisphaerales bacterium]